MNTTKRNLMFVGILGAVVVALNLNTRDANAAYEGDGLDEVRALSCNYDNGSFSGGNCGAYTGSGGSYYGGTDIGSNSVMVTWEQFASNDYGPVMLGAVPNPGSALAAAASAAAAAYQNGSLTGPGAQMLVTNAINKIGSTTGSVIGYVENEFPVMVGGMRVWGAYLLGR